MTTDDELHPDCAPYVEPVAEPSPLAVAMKVVSLAEPTSAGNVRVGLALLALAREAARAEERYGAALDAAQHAEEAAMKAFHEREDANARLRVAVTEAGQR